MLPSTSFCVGQKFANIFMMSETHTLGIRIVKFSKKHIRLQFGLYTLCRLVKLHKLDDPVIFKNKTKVRIDFFFNSGKCEYIF